MSQPWIRLYRESLHDPKIVTLSDRQHRAWHNLLLVADDSGALPCIRDVASHLRLSITEAEQLILELVEAQLVDVDAMSGPITYRMHGWAKRQFKSDDVTDRVRKHRENKKKRARSDNETTMKRFSNGEVTPPDTYTDTDTEIVPPPNPLHASRPRGKEQDLRSDWKIGGGKGREGGRLTTLTARAEGLGLPVEEMLATIERNKPARPAGYFLGMAIKRLREQLPSVPDQMLIDALNGKPKPWTLVTGALIMAEEAR